MVINLPYYYSVYCFITINYMFVIYAIEIYFYHGLSSYKSLVEILEIWGNVDFQLHVQLIKLNYFHTDLLILRTKEISIYVDSKLLRKNPLQN